MIPQEVFLLKNILESFLGKSKKDLDESYQLQFPCPRCIETKGEHEAKKYNLEINLLKGVYNCWSCGQYDNEMHGSIIKLIRLYGNNNILNEYKEVLKNLKLSKLYQLKYEKDDFNIDFTQSEINNIHFPKNYRKFNKDNIKYDEKPLSYLFKRGITWDIINKFNLGYTLYDKNDKQSSLRIIIPSINEFGELNYWTGRDFTSLPKRQKYYNPSVERKELIFNEGKVNWNADVTLVEGPFDHLVVPNSIPLLGKVLKTDFKLYQCLTTKCNANINIFLDGDAINDVKKIYQLLNHDKLYGKIRYIPVRENEDPSSIFEKYGKKGIISYLSKSIQIPEVFL